MSVNQCTITQMGSAGKGFAKFGDKHLFFPKTIPGDIVAFNEELLTNTRSHQDVPSFNLIQPSTDRIASSCPYFSSCGGCDWLMSSYHRQKEWKIQSFAHSWKRMFHSDLPSDLLNFFEPPLKTEFRQRAVFHLNYHHDLLQLGFYRTGTREVIALEFCQALNPLLNNLMSEIKLRLPTLNGDFFPIELEVQGINFHPETFLPQNLILSFHPDRKKLALQSIPINQLIEDLRKLPFISWADWSSHAYNSKHYFLEAQDGINFYAMPRHFVASNYYLNRQLRTLVKDIAVQEKSSAILDLFCGNGNLSLMCASHVPHLVGVEPNQNALSALRHSLKTANISNYHAIDSSGQDFILGDYVEKNEFDCIIYAPPGEGSRAIAKKLVDLSPKNIIMISHDMQSFLHELVLLRKKNYQIQSLNIFDIFPQTHHLETAVWLKR